MTTGTTALAGATPGQAGGMFLLFSNRLGCLTSLLISAGVTIVLLMLMR